MWDVITHQCPNFMKIRAWMSDHIFLFHVDVITCPCPDPDAGLANPYKWRRPAVYFQFS